jgi:hypothetical protein
MGKEPAAARDGCEKDRRSGSSPAVRGADNRTPQGQLIHEGGIVLSLIMV